MLRILKNIKNNFIFLISLFLISPVFATGKPSSKYDGVYTFIGILTQVNSKEIKILTDNKSINFELENIKKANISFDKFKVKVIS